MANKKYLYLLSLLFLAGCSSMEKEPVKMGKEPSLQEKKLLQADTFFKKKDFQKAFILYREAQKEAKDTKEFHTLQLKIASSLLEMHNFPAALEALVPMPELPATLHDCRKLVMASRILQKMNGKKEHIESLLEVALDNSITGEGVIPFKASGYAELGRIYVSSNKIPRAIKCFEYAAKLYTMAGDEENASVCRNIMEYLR